MNLLLLDRDEVLADGRVVLNDRRADHLRRVIGVRIGQTIRAGIVRGPLAEATVRSLEQGVELDVRTIEERPIPRIDLVLALPRPKALSRIVQAAASFGVRRIDVINAWRVDASYFASHKVSEQLLALDARLGCEQGRQTYLPDVSVHRFFATYVDEVLRPRLAQERTRHLLVLHPSAAPLIEEVVTPGAQHELILAVGPDGGFVEREVATLVGAGGQAVSCGEAVLRSETAVVAVLSQIDLLRRTRLGKTTS